MLQTACSNDNLRKSKAKEYMDKRHKAAPSTIQQGDQVLLLQKRANKLSTRYDPRPFTVVKKRGVSVELSRGEARLFRNLSMVKKVIPSTQNTEQSSRPARELRIPRNLSIAVPNMGYSQRPSRDRHIPSYPKLCFGIGHFITLLIQAFTVYHSLLLLFSYFTRKGGYCIYALRT